MQHFGVWIFTFVFFLIFVQSFVRTQDADVEKYLKAFTFLSLAEISQIMKRHNVSFFFC